MSYPTSTLKNIISNFVPSWDMPEQGDLVRCFTPNYFENDEILIGNRDFLSYVKTTVPYVEVEGKIYYADTIEAVPRYSSEIFASCRKYKLVSPWETKGNVGEKLVYTFY